jgi:hypothetical protein
MRRQWEVQEQLQFPFMGPVLLPQVTEWENQDTFIDPLITPGPLLQVRKEKVYQEKFVFQLIRPVHLPQLRSQ